MAENVVILEPGDERAQKIAKAMSSPTAGDILRLLASEQKTSSAIMEELSIPLNTVKYHVDNLIEAGLVSVADTKYSIKGREVKIYSLTDQLVIVAPRQSNVRSFLLKYASLFAIVLFATFGFAHLAPLFGGPAGFGGLQEAASVPVPAVVPGLSPVPSPVVTMVPTTIPPPLPTLVQTVAPTAYRGNGAEMAKSVYNSGTSAQTLAPVPTQVPTAIPTTAVPAITPVPIQPPVGIQEGSTGAANAAWDSGVHSVAPGIDPVLAFLMGGVLVILVLLIYEGYLLKRKK